jgi:predicted peroxiredoxin
MNTKKWVTAGVGLVFVSFMLFGCPDIRAAEARDGVFIHVSQNDAHRVLMALNMARIMSEDHAVLMYFDVKAVNVLLRDAKDLTYKQFPSSKQQISTLPSKGVILVACPECLKAAGKSAGDLASGVEVADKSRFFSFTTGRILTLDY